MAIFPIEEYHMYKVLLDRQNENISKSTDSFYQL